MVGKQSRKIVICASAKSKNEVILCDWIDAGSETPREKCMNALESFHLVEALQAAGEPAESIEIAAITAIHSLKARIEIIERLIKKGNKPPKAKAPEEIQEKPAFLDDEPEIELGEDFL